MFKELLKWSFGALLLASQHTFAIVGGQSLEATHPMAPQTVAIFDQADQSLCTGTLIHPKVVLTAAHCLNHSATDLKIIFHTNAQQILDDSVRYNHLVRTAKQTLRHKDFYTPTPTSEYGDIGLIELQDEAPEFATTATFFEGTFAQEMTTLVAGYGITEQKIVKVHRDDPRLVSAIAAGEGGCNNYKTICEIIVSTKDRQLNFAQVTIARIEKSEIKLNEKNGVGTCYGDSGGPAFIEDQGVLKLWGVNSRGDGSGRCGKNLGVKTRIDHYRTWIAQVLTLWNLP